MVKGALAIVAGYAGMVAIVVASQPIIVRLFLPEAAPGRLTRSYLAANLSCAFVAAVVAGVVCVKLAPEPSARYVRILAVLVLLLSLLSAVTDHDHPFWYFGVIGVLAAAGILVGRVVVYRW
ncbi:MAG: hypothetical protein HY048_14260 [Acidobacteria bacterium]|nr:hypothetical protein [Acidobacteriota bacterium]